MSIIRRMVVGSTMLVSFHKSTIGCCSLLLAEEDDLTASGKPQRSYLRASPWLRRRQQQRSFGGTIETKPTNSFDGSSEDEEEDSDSDQENFGE